MIKYDLYTGMGGGFGGARYNGTYEYDSEEEALQDAYNLAVEEYQSYEGSHGILSWEDCREDLIDTYADEGDDEHPYIPDDEDVDLHYTEQVEGWIVYYIKIHDDNNPPEE